MSELEPLIRRGVVTVDPERAEECCGVPRDEDGFCQHRPGHPVYVSFSSDPLQTKLDSERGKGR